MLFRNRQAGGLAISQPAHAWISGQILAEWHVALDRPVVLAAEQHDLAWLDWETAPSFDPETGRPHLFRAIGAAEHAPMWTSGVERASHAWGMRPALLISRHGGVIYRRFVDRHRLGPSDADAAERYLREQASKESAWAQALDLDEATLAHDTGLIAFADTLSLAFCGELPVPIEIEAPDLGTVRVTAEQDLSRFALSPWPFRADTVTFAAEARKLPPAGRFDTEAAMRLWLADTANRVTLRVTAQNLN